MRQGLPAPWFIILSVQVQFEGVRENWLWETAGPFSSFSFYINQKKDREKEGGRGVRNGEREGRGERERGKDREVEDGERHREVDGEGERGRTLHLTVHTWENTHNIEIFLPPSGQPAFGFCFGYPQTGFIYLCWPPQLWQIKIRPLFIIQGMCQKQTEKIVLKVKTFSKEDKTEMAFLNKITFLVIFLSWTISPEGTFWLNQWRGNWKNPKHP